MKPDWPSVLAIIVCFSQWPILVPLWTYSIQLWGSRASQFLPQVPVLWEPPFTFLLDFRILVPFSLLVLSYVFNSVFTILVCTISFTEVHNGSAAFGFRLSLWIAWIYLVLFLPCFRILKVMASNLSWTSLLGPIFYWFLKYFLYNSAFLPTPSREAK